MRGKWRKGKKESEPVSNTGVDHITAKIDHTFVSSSKPRKGRKLPLTLPNLTRKHWLLIVVIIVALAVGGYFAFVREPEPVKPTVTSEGVKLRKLGDDDLKKEVDKLVFEGKQVSAQELIRFQDNIDRELPQMLLVSTYVSQKNYRGALDVLLYMEQKSIGEPWRIARNIGERYESLKDKQNAALYYKKALDFLKSAENVPVKSDEIYFLEQNIKKVER